MRPILLIAVLVPCAASLAGCTILGGLIGHAVDANNPVGYDAASRIDLRDLDEDTFIRVTRTDGRVDSGRFAFLRGLSGRMEDAVEPDSTFRDRFPDMPAAGDTVVVHSTYDLDVRGVFIGADHRLLAVRALPDGKPRGWNFAFIRGLTNARGTHLDVGDIEEAVRDDAYPLLATVVLRDGETTTEIPYRDIQRLELRDTPNSGQLVGMSIGLVVDVAVVVAILVSRSHDEPAKPAPTSDGHDRIMCGCPFLFSRTGDRIEREGECFSGSFTAAGRRTDVGRLEHARVTDGTLRLVLADVLPEIDFVDELAVLEVLHPAETFVVPAPDGTLFCLRDPVSPRRATDSFGDDATAALAGDDDATWSTDPLQTVLDRHPSDGRCRLDLEYPPRPAGTSGATLFLTVRNTAYAAALQTGFLALYGRGLPEQYERWERDAGERSRLVSTMTREGMLALSVWDGRGWAPAGSVWETGVAEDRRVAVPLDAAWPDGSPIRIRLEGPVGVWIVNRAVLGFGTERPARVRRLPLETATRENGVSVARAIRERDGVVATLERGNRIDAAYRAGTDAEAPSAKLRRTFLFRATGHYRTAIVPDLDPNPQTLARIFDTPRYFAAYALDRYRDRLGDAAKLHFATSPASR